MGLVLVLKARLPGMFCRGTSVVTFENVVMVSQPVVLSRLIQREETNCLN